VVNEGRRALRVRSIALASLVDGRRVPADAKLLQSEAGPQRSTLVAEYSGVWHEGGSWALEAVVTSDKGETIAGRVRRR
jgi:hypothetical protein